MILSNGAKALINVGDGGSGMGLLVGYTTGDLNNFVTVYGNSTLSVTGDSYIGYGGASSNAVTVTGANALWSNNGAIYVGNGSVGNSLVISNGGLVTATGVDVSGGSYPASSNTILITGVGSTLTSSGAITNGGSGYGIVTIASGGTLSTPNFINSGGGGSVGILNVGTYGASNTGVTLGAATVTFGGGSSAVYFNQADTLTVSSIFSGTASAPYYVTLAQLGSGTTVLTGRGGTNTADVFVEGGQLAFQGAAFNNSTGNIYVGYQGAGNAFGPRSNSTSVSMLLSSNAVVKTDALYVGSGAGKGSNSITVTGSSTLTVTNSSYIGYGGSDSNSVTVTGSGSVWSNAGTINVGEGLGNGSVGNSLVISNGGHVNAG
jgi:T5SS/PEP-CTERM-associated repeat protein